MIKNVGNQTIGAGMVSTVDGSAFVGTVTVYITGDGGAQTIGSVGSGICTAEGNGYYSYRPAQAETDFDLIAFTFVGSGAIPATIQVATILQAQQNAIQAITGPGAMATETLIEDALQELGIPGIGQTARTDDVQFALRKLNRLLDNWNADRRAVYASQFATFTLVPSLSPHTIGSSSATWTVTQRPVSIEGANLVLSTVNNPQTTITLRDAQWYQGLSVPTLQTSIPTDLYYQPDWPNGSLFFYPVPTVAYDVQLMMRIVLAQLALSDTFTLPPGYQDAITLTLAETCSGAFGRPLDPTLAMKAREARARIFANNDVVPRLRTWDAGMPGGHTVSTGNYLTGWQGSN